VSATKELKNLMNNGRISTVGRRLVNINEWHMSSNSAKKDLALFPYRLTYVQGLHIDDFRLRAEYCHWFLNTFDDALLEKTSFSDEAWFHLTENPHMEAPLHPQKIGIWAAICQRRIIGSLFFEGKLYALS
jgi:hypothetical protein